MTETNRGRAYVRVSQVGDRQPDEFHSPELQLRVIRDYAEREGITLDSTVYEDIDRTGRDFSREGIQRAFQDAATGAYDVLVLRDVSRFGRNVAESLANIRQLRDDHGVRVVSATEQFDDTPEGQFQLTLFLSMAELYSAQVGRRWSEVARHRVASGYTHGPTPLGYVKPGKGQPIVPDPAVAPIVRRAFEEYASGRSLRSIAADMTRRRGANTAVVTVRRMLENPVYVGKIGTWETRKRGRRSERVPGTQRVVDGVHEAIVSEDLWAAVQERRERDKRQPPKRSATPVHAVVGLCVCGLCGARMSLETVAGSRSLVCPGRARFKTCQGPGAPRADTILRLVLEELEAWALGSHPPAADAERARRVAEADLDAARERVGAVERALGELTAQRARGEVSEAAYKAGAAVLEEDLRRAREELDALAAPPIPEDLFPRLGVEPSRVWVERVSQVADAVASGVFGELGAEDQARLLRSVVHRVVLFRGEGSGRRWTADRVEIIWAM